jgi:hypothetical protein
MRTDIPTLPSALHSLAANAEREKAAISCISQGSRGDCHETRASYALAQEALVKGGRYERSYDREHFAPRISLVALPRAAFNSQTISARFIVVNGTQAPLLLYRLIREGAAVNMRGSLRAHLVQSVIAFLFDVPSTTA